ncbi:EamA family transporter [Streptomyces sp. TRM S81-3]|uniref:EamA family transporter n=1 Tax=Streptomyces griseicoloratus TaxID=2752516 RepID=A0A926L050_9ACTN|nr:EamA family transporter [Streptomyces griseicoloratus]MBD0420062.1 EamA family transporter [Streptomyces griseicoloratus]
MEADFRWIALTAVAPVAWGANYYVTREFLPAGHALWGAALRALPAGCLLLAAARERPRGAWWWRSAVLGVLNTSAFFALVYVASQLLATSTASMVMALTPLVLTLGAWALLGERPRVVQLAAAVVGLAGVALMLGGPGGQVRPAGVAASVAALLVSAAGFLLSKRWDTGRPGVLAVTAWQLTCGGVLLLIAAGAVEGPPPPVDGPVLAAYAYSSLVATALAFLAWFAGLRRLPAGTVGLVGLLNPVTGVLLGTTVAGEGLSVPQGAGMVLVVAAVLGGRRTPADAPAPDASCPDGPSPGAGQRGSRRASVLRWKDGKTRSGTQRCGP